MNMNEQRDVHASADNKENTDTHIFRRKKMETNRQTDGQRAEHMWHGFKAEQQNYSLLSWILCQCRVNIKRNEDF